MDIMEIQSFFFKAMLEGWVTGNNKYMTSDMSGYKAFQYRYGDFYLLDRYTTTRNSVKSVGGTTIWFKDDPVWVMNYGGYYEKSAIKFLKHVLNKAYKAQKFIGGRGFQLYLDSTLVYINQPRINEFAKFEGREEIFNTETIVSLGFHEYWGMSLF